MLKVINVAGARPNFMKVAPIVAAMNRRANEFRHVLVHTGQHYDSAMSSAFFRDLEIPEPDIDLGVGSGSHAVQTAASFRRSTLRHSRKPDWVLVVGDVNSTVACALVCAKLGVKVAHIEAGLRSRDRTMRKRQSHPHRSDFGIAADAFRRGERKSAREGIPVERIRMVGNIMIDSLNANLERARGSTILSELNLEGKDYGTLTLHRPSNVDERAALLGILNALKEIGRRVPIIFPAHPRTRKMMTNWNSRLSSITRKVS